MPLDSIAEQVQLAFTPLQQAFTPVQLLQPPRLVRLHPAELPPPALAAILTYRACVRLTDRPGPSVLAAGAYEVWYVDGADSTVKASSSSRWSFGSSP